MPREIGRDDVHKLIDDGAQVVEVLERRQYEAAHLPSALHLPAWEMTRSRVEAAGLDAARPVVVYCFDSL